MLRVEMLSLDDLPLELLADLAMLRPIAESEGYEPWTLSVAFN